MKLTGPAVWSDAVTGFLLTEFGVEFGTAPYSSDTLRDHFVLIGDVLLLPMRSLAVGSAGTDPSFFSILNLLRLLRGRC